MEVERDKIISTIWPSINEEIFFPHEYHATKRKKREKCSEKLYNLLITLDYILWIYYYMWTVLLFHSSVCRKWKPREINMNKKLPCDQTQRRDEKWRLCVFFNYAALKRFICGDRSCESGFTSSLLYTFDLTFMSCKFLKMFILMVATKWNFACDLSFWLICFISRIFYFYYCVWTLCMLPYDAIRHWTIKKKHFVYVYFSVKIMGQKLLLALIFFRATFMLTLKSNCITT
jgi:hypothetical protein